MQSLKNILLFTLLLFLIISQNTFSQREKEKHFDNYIEQYLANKKVPSISAGVLKDGRIIWLSAKGYTDIENNVPASINSLYRIASISKSITAVAIMQLYEKGLIDIDKDARSYIPYFPEKKWHFTIRQILNHTSGIRNYKDGEFHSKNFYSSTNEALKVFSLDTLDYEPGTKYEYSSLAYSLLAAIIENVTKMSYEDYLSKNIFIPAEMKNTAVDIQRKIQFNRAKGYEKNAYRDFQNAPLADLSIKVAGGGLLSTAQDLLFFAKALLEGKLLKSSTLSIMLNPTKLKSGKVIDYGLGFALSFEGDSLKYFYHIGGGTGFSTELYINPKEKLATVHLLNIVDRNLELPAEELARIELGLEYHSPSKTIADELIYIYKTADIDSTIKSCIKILNSPDSSVYNLNESELVNFAKDLLSLNKSSDAIKFLKVLADKFPKSFTVEVTMADAYLKDSNEGLALKHYRLALQINKYDTYVLNRIKQLTKK